MNPGADQWGWAHFAGALGVDSLLQDLSTREDLAGGPYSLDKASLIVWSGESAGGIGSSAHVDRVASSLPGARVVAAPIAVSNVYNWILLFLHQSVIARL